MARYYDNGSAAIQAQALKDQRERDDRAAVASGNVDQNSALYRHAKLNGWDLGGGNELHGPARANAVAAQNAQTRMLESQAEMADAQADAMKRSVPQKSYSNVDWLMDNEQRQGYADIVANAQMQEAQTRKRKRTALTGAYGSALDNGGFTHPSLAKAMGVDVGDPNFVGGTIDKNGNYISMTRGNNGKIEPSGIVPAQEVLKAAVETGDVKNADRIYKRFFEGKYRPEQIEQMSGYSQQWSNDARQSEIRGKAAQMEQKQILSALETLQKLRGGGNKQLTANDFVRALLGNKDFVSSLSQMPVYEKDEMGKDTDRIAMTKDELGNDVPQMRNATDDELLGRIMNIAKKANDMESGRGNPDDPYKQREDVLLRRFDELLAGNAEPENPLVSQAKKEQIARDAITSQHRQQALEIIDDKGNRTLTTGYIVNGKVYDDRGEERHFPAGSKVQSLDGNSSVVVDGDNSAQTGGAGSGYFSEEQSIPDDNGGKETPSNRNNDVIRKDSEGVRWRIVFKDNKPVGKIRVD